ncbi:MAG: DNA-binding protein [Pseudomonadota bacterium]|nr:DNA-binding protein [Pseudomonadota bacterium]
MSDYKKLYSLKEQREEAGIGRTLQAALIKKGVLQTVSIGRRRLVTGESHRALIERGAA